MRSACMVVLALGLLYAGCEARSSDKQPTQATLAPQQGDKPAAQSSEALTATAGERRFGAEPKLAGDPVPVDQVLSAPDAHVGKTIKCSGVVGRVCQAAGCWLELQAKEGGEGLRVPMANHAFFIPKDAVGKLAVIEGQLHREALPPEQRDHYASEGMKATGPLSLEATSVVLQ